MTTSIPRGLVDDLRAGRIVLFLGAGASVGATDESGGGPPLGNELRDRIVSQFLDARYADRSLAVVAELAISERDLIEVQEFVADQFRNLQPADLHQDLATFKWRAIATTNFDRVLQKAYEAHDKPAQKLVPILSNRNRVDEQLQSPDHVAYLKLHGCVTVTEDPELPLILTVDQYATHTKNRHLLFNRLEGLANEYPVLFVGHRLEDTDIRDMLRRLTTNLDTRPRYYLIDPGATEVDSRFWDAKKVTVLPLELSQFLEAVAAEIPEEVRPLLKRVELDHPIRSRFVTDDPVSPRLSTMLGGEIDYLWSDLPYQSGTPKQFYRGFDLGWYPIRENLDVRRALVDTLLTDVIIRPETDRPTTAELYAIRAEAGAGKSLLLRRVAWEAATDADALVLWVGQYGYPEPDVLEEIHRQTRSRIFLFWDHAGDNVGGIAHVLKAARRRDLPLTVITAERSNEWTMNCGRLDEYLTDSFRLRYMSETELHRLGELLQEHDCLGPGLAGKTPEERVIQLKEIAGRQLLVALHEATLGDPFEIILQDEFESLRPVKAQQVYLTVCVLNRLRTPVRAGFISRVHGIPFVEFKEQLLDPLEHVVEVRERSNTGDYYYQARHPHIAQIVFTRILTDRDDRINEYLRIVENLNLSYNSDRAAFRGLLRAKSLHELFPEYQDVRAIFNKAEEIGSREAYLFQQRANYERIRDDGNLTDAERFLEKARELDPHDESILHTLAEVYRTRAEKTATPLARMKLREEARAILRPIVGGGRSDGSDPYARVTLIKLALDDLRDTLGDEDSTDREIDEAIRDVERLLEAALQQHPDEQFLHTAEADFGRLLADHDRSFKALERAFESNQRDPYVASRLARALCDRDDEPEALDVLNRALNANPGDPRLNFQYADTLRRSGEKDPKQLAYYYSRAFTPGDRNYEAQFWFARYGFDTGEEKWKQRAEETFRHLRGAHMGYARRHEIRDVLKVGDRDRVFRGTVDRLEQSYGWITRDGPADSIFMHNAHIADHVWDTLKQGDRVCFALGFSFAGPRAVSVERLQ